MEKVQEYRVYLKDLILRYIGMSQEYRMSDTIQGRIGGAKCACEVALKEFNRIFADQPAPPAESLHEMAKRMCESTDCCEFCPIGCGHTHCVVGEYAELTDEEALRQLDALRAWASENPPKPVKTYREDFLEKFPGARTDEYGTPKAWLQNVYTLSDTKRIEYLSMLDRGQWDKPLGYWEA